jgi:membrane-anchored glycerophosphoryl diester phosphodiesterase (GDPDase)
VPIDAGKFIKIIFLGIWTSIAAFISWYKKIFLYYFIGLIALFFLTVILFVLGQWLPAIILTVLGIVLFLIYYIVIIHNIVRLSLSTPIMLQKDIGILETAKESWELSKGKTLEIFFAFLVVLVPIMIVSMVAGGIVNAVTALMNNAVIAVVLQQMLQIFLRPLTAIIGVFGFISIYSEVVKTKKGKK